MHASSTRRPHLRGRSVSAIGVAAASALMLVGCAPGGSGSTTASSTPVSTSPGSAKVTLTLYDGQGLSTIDNALIAGFEKAHPNITVKGDYDPDTVHAQNLPRVMSGTHPPDIAAVSSITGEVKDGLYRNISDYSKAYGWGSLGSQLDGGKVTASGVEGSGPLYGFSFGFSYEGVYYNKPLAAKLGITTMPATLAEFEADLAKAKAAGITPIIVAGQLGLGTTAYQNLLDAYAGPKPVTDWVYNVPKATINTPDGLKAATELKTWIGDGYFNSDVNAMTQDQSYSEFAAGHALFMMQGTWANPILAAAAPKGSYGFFAPPTDGATGPKTAIYSSSMFAISAKTTHPNQAAAFLNWLKSPAAEKIVLANGSIPVNTGQKVAVQAGSMTSTLVDVFNSVSAANGLTPFVQNATSGINNAAWVPQSQLLFGGKVTPQQFLTNIQSAYETELKQ